MMPVRQFDPPSAATIFTDDADQLAMVRLPAVQAVVCRPARRPAWELMLAQAVEEGRFVIERRTLTATAAALCHLLEQQLPSDGLPFDIRLALIDDLCALADRLGAITHCSALMLRLFTEAPTEHCGFHVDTVAPGRPPFGLLKVYNGQGTAFVDPADLLGVQHFYSYLGRRESLTGQWNQALAQGHSGQAAAVRTERRALDAALPFVRSPSQVRQVPAGATVAFRHLDIREHWSADSGQRAWIHCSPMAGVIRLVASLTPLDGCAGRLG